MGTKLPKASPDSPFPSFCWTAGIFTIPPNTPEFLDIRFDGIKRGDTWTDDLPGPPNDTFTLKVTPIGNYTFAWEPISIILNFSAIRTDLRLFMNNAQPPVPFLVIDGPCQIVLANSFISPVGVDFYDGIAVVQGVF